MRTSLFSNFCVLTVGLAIGVLKSESQKTCVGNFFVGCAVDYQVKESLL